MQLRNPDIEKKIIKFRNSAFYKKCLSNLTVMIVKDIIDSKNWSNAVQSLRDACEKQSIDWVFMSVIIIEDLQKLRDVKLK